MVKGTRSVLVATDLTGGCDEVLRAGAALAALTGAELHVLYVFEFEPPPYSSAQAVDGSGTFPERIAEAKRALDEQIARTVRPGIAVASRTVEVYVAYKSIVDRARLVGAELIVLGRHRRRGPVDAWLGSTADRVVRTADAPCLLVDAPLRLPLRRVVAPIDLSEPAVGALRMALEWAAALGPSTEGQPGAAEVLVLHVIPRVYDFDDLPFDRAVAGPEVHDAVERARAEVGADPAPSVREVLHWGDSPAEEIVRVADEEAADLVVLGTHGYGAIRRALIGSVASGVARAASCPVLLVPPALWREESTDVTAGPAGS